MGGLGAGYEQAIQEMAFEFMRWMMANPPDGGWESMGSIEKSRAYSAACDEACSGVIDRIGPSGAMHGAAMNIASVFSRNGYADGLAMAPENRHILVTKGYESA
jgi:hypothetical protein